MAVALKLVIEKMDREPFSELVEIPIHPHLLHVQTPLVNALDPHFHIQLNGKLVWYWGSITESKLFEARSKPTCENTATRSQQIARKELKEC